MDTNNLTLILTAIGTILAILGIPQIFGMLWKDILGKLLHGRLSWKEVERLVADIAEKMKNDRPDLILGVGRGGITSAGLLCSKLTNDGSLRLGTIKTQDSPKIKIETINTVRQVTAENPEENEVGKITFSYFFQVEDIDFDISQWNEKKVLIIIGETVTAQTLRDTRDKIINECTSKGVKIDMKYATLVLHNTKRNHSEVDTGFINYIGKTYKGKIIMPWK